MEQDLDWIVPMDVQDEAIPLILGGGDVMVAAGKRESYRVKVSSKYATIKSELY